MDADWIESRRVGEKAARDGLLVALEGSPEGAVEMGVRPRRVN